MRSSMCLLLLAISTVFFTIHEACASNKLRSLGQMRPSFYWISIEPDDGKQKTKKLLDVHGRVLAITSADYYRKLRMEGTGRLTNGKVVNFHRFQQLPNGKKEILWRFCGKEAPYGFGYEDIPLVPYRSAAVDPKLIPIGSWLYIPAAKGIALPDGTEHDGYFHAIDIGDAIEDRKIDIFTAIGDQRRVFEAQGIETGKKIEVFLVDTSSHSN